MKVIPPLKRGYVKNPLVGKMTSFFVAIEILSQKKTILTENWINPMHKNVLPGMRVMSYYNEDINSKRDMAFNKINYNAIHFDGESRGIFKFSIASRHGKSYHIIIELIIF